MEGKMLTESMEDYLEMFYRLYLKQGYVRPIDLSDAIRVQPSSVTRMIQKLNEAGYLTYEKYRNISLTPLGLEYGKFLVWRDETLKEFFYLFGDLEGVEEQVEGIEHYIIPQTMEIFKNMLSFFKAHPDQLQDFLAYKRGQASPAARELGLLRAWLFRHAE
jgi:Mn-dependent DtxR family transcriptional regulator